MTKEQETPVVREEPAVRGALCDAFYGADGVLLPAMRTSAWGYADLVNERANTAETRFATASAGKAFIAASIMHLIEAGKLDLTSCFSQVCDDVVHPTWADVTVEQLLTHTSAVPDYFDESVMDDYADLWLEYPNYSIRTQRDLYPLFADRPAVPDTEGTFRYNNSGYVLLGRILESVTGEVFDQWLGRNLFLPAGMTRTGYYELDRLPQGCAYSYIEDGEGGWYTNIYSVDVKGTGAGGAFTTVTDIARFWEFLLRGTFLSAATVSSMWSPHAHSDEGVYGYGFWLFKDGDSLTPYIEGCDPGVAFISRLDNRPRRVARSVTVVSNFGDDVWAACDAALAVGE